MPSWDLKCDDCQKVYHFHWTTAADRDEWLPTMKCSEGACEGRLSVVPSAPNFVVNGYNARNGYTKGKS